MPLDPYLHQPRFIVWRNEPREKGKITKIPYNPKTKREAKSNDPRTWGTFDEAMYGARAIRSASELGGGFGLQLGDLGDGYALGGLDLDDCRSEDGTIEPWAAEAIERFGSYTEVSPSGTGVKIFLLYHTADLPKFRAAMGDAKWSKMFKRGSGGDHPPAIEVHLGHRFFTTTWNHCPETPDEIRVVEPEKIFWLLREHGPKFARQHPRSPATSRQMLLAAALPQRRRLASPTTTAGPESPSAWRMRCGAKVRHSRNTAKV